ncbi:hypothetical protein E6P09_14570 [Haloferax mediterranei ATCC 33500]|nr:twin-arginine translocase subunit TatC [Haloferax mediterranei]AHZ23502.1 hypothetical protein BM92_13010 [Haloferax mediterranei ATCC 33500]MDX5987120.1 twin-arginine translocase subunit TatC [Haloferax mediterranei ATCC 33500]QCQ76434.1 hypothetical protein E6P09_14570 [Haloferax mediterranei ATCC 33500]
MDTTGVVEPFDPRGYGLSPLAATLRCRAPRLIAGSLLVAVVVFFAARDPGYLSPTAGLRTDVFASGSPDLLVRLELAGLVGALVGGTHLVLLTGRDAAVDLRSAAKYLISAAAAFIIGVGLTWFVAPSVVDLLISTDRLASGSRQAILELELFLPVAGGLGMATAPLLVGLARSGALPSRLGERTKGMALLLTVAFAAFFSPPDPTTFALYAMPPLAGVAVAVAWIDFR